MVKVKGLLFHVGYLVNPAPFVEKNTLSRLGTKNLMGLMLYKEAILRKRVGAAAKKLSCVTGARRRGPRTSSEWHGGPGEVFRR